MCNKEYCIVSGMFAEYPAQAGSFDDTTRTGQYQRCPEDHSVAGRLSDSKAQECVSHAF